ncbi:MAG: hypothetical protein WC935_07015 [Thermoleophilia bacterium]
MPETKTVRRNTNLNQLRKLYAHRPIVAEGASDTKTSEHKVAPMIDASARRYLRKDISRTVLAVTCFLILFAVLYFLQNSAGIQKAIAWVGSHTGF